MAVSAKEMEAEQAGKRVPALSELSHMSPWGLCSTASPFLESFLCPRLELWFINHTALSFHTCKTEFGVWSCFLSFVREHSSVCFTNNKVVDKALKQEC